MMTLQVTALNDSTDVVAGGGGGGGITPKNGLKAEWHKTIFYLTYRPKG